MDEVANARNGSDDAGETLCGVILHSWNVCDPKSFGYILAQRSL